MAGGEVARNKKAALRLNIWLLKLSRNWVKVAIVVIGIYVGLPVLAPVLVHFGLTGPAQLIYTLYSPFCHQFAFRSFFLFGEQTVYPRAISGTTLKPFEAYVSALPQFASMDTSQWSLDLIFAARAFLGNAQMGYKTALCERDMAIYAAMFCGALLYAHPKVRRKLRPVPVWLYLILGIAPIAIDGFSQLFSYPPFNWWPARETLPVFRIVTGSLFGLMNVWLAFPFMELSMRDTRLQIEAKLARVGIYV
jgi:uncharacterized membrane protein